MSSSGIIARVRALCQKADELCNKGYLLRAVENYGRAVEAARALGADNLMALHMQQRQGGLLLTHAVHLAETTAAEADNRIAAHRAQCITLLSGAVAALERRRVADTLLEGKCTAVEEAWKAWDIQLDARLSDVTAVSFAALVGYEQFLRAGAYVLSVLAHARLFAAECSAAQFHSFAQHVVHAAQLMQQPRRHGDISLSMETEFVPRTRTVYSLRTIADAGVGSLFTQPLARAWQRLQRSGVLQARRVYQGTGSFFEERQAFHETVKKNMTAPDLRSCALPGCSAKEEHPAHFKCCAAYVPHRGLLLPRAPGGGLAGARESVQGGAQSCCCWG